MKKVIRIILIVIISIILLITLFILFESNRLYNNSGSKPLIVFSTESKIRANGISRDEIYNSLFFSVKYECILDNKSSEDNNLLLCSGEEFRLFNKYMLWGWIS